MRSSTGKGSCNWCGMGLFFRGLSLTPKGRGGRFVRAVTVAQQWSWYTQFDNCSKKKFCVSDGGSNHADGISMKLGLFTQMFRTFVCFKAWNHRVNVSPLVRSIQGGCQQTVSENKNYFRHSWFTSSQRVVGKRCNCGSEGVGSTLFRFVSGLLRCHLGVVWVGWWVATFQIYEAPLTRFVATMLGV